MLEFSQVDKKSYRKSFAGDTFNVAHYAAITGGSRIAADYLTAIGTDAESDDCLRFIERHKVGVHKIHRDPKHSLGLFTLANDEFGEKQYGYWRESAAVRYLFEQTRDLTGYDLIYISGITAAVTKHKDNLIEGLVTAKNNGAKIVFDFNHRTQLWTTEEAKKFALSILSFADIVKISDEEFEVLFPEQSMIGFSTQFRKAEWIYTCGGEKAEVWKNGEMLAQEKFKPLAKVVDTSAAGDSFLGTYLASYSLCNAAQRLKRAHEVAVQVIAYKGSIAPVDLTRLEI